MNAPVLVLLAPRPCVAAPSADAVCPPQLPAPLPCNFVLLACPPLQVLPQHVPCPLTAFSWEDVQALEVGRVGRSRGSRNAGWLLQAGIRLDLLGAWQWDTAAAL